VVLGDKIYVAGGWQHRLVTAGTKQLIAFVGEDGEEKRPDLELLRPSVNPLPASATASQQANAHSSHQ